MVEYYPPAFDECHAHFVYRVMCSFVTLTQPVAQRTPITLPAIYYEIGPKKMLSKCALTIWRS